MCILLLSLHALPAKVPPGVDPNDPAFLMGFLDVTKAPYKADPSGAQDSTEALQKAVNDARDFQYVCFFPSGTYLISKTLSCEQTVSKMNSTKTWDGKKQSYAGHRDNPCILIGSKKGTPCIDIVDSHQITITQVKSFKSGEGMLSIRSEKASLDSTQTATLFILK